MEPALIRSVRRCGSRRSVIPISAIVLVGMTVGGCSSEAPAAKSAYFDEVVAASKTAKSDFERTVLSDGNITRAEYEESVQKLVACAGARGVSIEPVAQGATYAYEVRTSATSDTVMGECSVGTTQVIESLYGDIVRNPTKGDYDALVASCLDRSGLAPAGYDKTRYVADRSAAKQGEVLTPKFPFDANDPRLAECEGNPTSH